MDVVMPIHDLFCCSRLLRVISNHFPGVPRACALNDQVLALHVVCALLCNDDNMYYCHITTRTSCAWA